MATPLTIGIASFVHIVVMTVLLRRFYATLLVLCALSASPLLAQSGASAPERIVSPVRTDLPGRTVWAFATSASAGTGTGTNITTFAATDKGLYKSSGGAWTLTSLDKQSVYAVKSRRVGNVTTLLVGTDKGVLRSTDGGNTWVSPEVTTGTVSTSNIVALKKVFDIEIVQPGNGNGNSNGNAGIWFAATEKGVYRSSNDGRSWSLVNIDRTADNNEVRGITTDGNTIIVNLWKEGLWRSTNNGNSWTKLTITGETALCRAVHAQQGTNATVWLVGSVSGNIWRSTNNGNSWTRVYQGTSTARSIVASSLSQAGIDAFTGWERPGTLGERWIYLFAATPTGIAYSLNEGLSWKLSRTPSSEKAVSLVAWNNKLFVGTEAERSIGSAVKEGAQLQNTTGGTNEYDATCTDGCSGGGSGSGSNNTAVIGAPVLTRTAPRIYLTPSTTSPGNYSIAEQLQVYGSGIFEIGGFPLDATVTRASTGQVLTRGIFYGIGDFSANGGGWFNGEQYGTFSFSTALPSDNYGIQIRNISGLSNTIFFAVGPSFDDLTFTGVSANSNIASSPVTMVISGTGIDQWTQLLIDNQTPQNIVYTYRNPNGYSMTVTFVAPSDGGNHTLTLQRGTSTTQSRTWTIASPIPALSSVTTDPSPARVGQTASMSIGGQKFAADAQVRIYGPNNTVTTYNPNRPNSATQMTVSSFTPPTTPGVYAVDVVNPGASSPSEQTSYMVAYPAPTLTAIAPTRVIQNLPTTLSLTGTGILTGVTEFGLSSGLSSTLSGASVTFTAPAKGTYSASLSNPTTYGGGGTATLSNALTVVAPNPAPASLTLDSTRLLVNDGVRTLTLTGTGFLTGSNSDDNARTAVTVDGATVTPQSISATQIVLSVPTAGTNAGAHTIALTNPAVFSMASGGGGTASTTYSVAFPAPTLTSLDADSLDLNIGTTPQTLTLTGTGFVNASRVFAGARELTVSSRSATSLVITIPAGFFTEPTTIAVRVDNPITSGVTPADGGSSGTKTLTIKNLLPTLTSISPAPVVAGENATLTLAGSNFITNTSQVFAGSTALVTTVSSASSLTAALPASLVADIGTLSLTVRNTFGTDIKTSLPKSLRVIHPTPEVTSLAPEHSAQVTIPAFDSTQTLTISGAKFSLTRARVLWSKNGVETPLTLLPNPTASQLRVTVPASLLTELGSVTVRVQNVDSADAQGGPSASSTLTIIPPRPVVTSVMPNSATAGAGAVTVTITGAKFISSGLSILIRNAQNGFVRGLLNPTFTSNTSVSGMIPADVVTLAGNYTITVVNAANASGQGGGESTSSAPFTILNPAPTISSLTPNPATVFAPFTLEVQGTGFVSGATSVTVDGQVFAPASVTVLSSVRLTVNVAAITSAKNASVSITNPKLNNQGGGTATATFPVVPPVPTVSQAQGNAGGGTLTRNIAGTLTVTGTGFVTGAVIIFNGQDLTTTVVDQTTVRANVAAAALPTQGVYAVAVRNPQFGNQGGGTSSPVVGVTVQNPTPTLSGISPTAVTRGNDASITLTGSNFYDGVVAYLSGASASTFATVFVNNGSLTLSIPASSLPVAGSYSIAIKNSEPTPGFSGTRTLTVNNPAPVLSSLSVTETEAYSSDVTLTVTGSGFENGLLAWWTPSGASRQALPAPTSVSAGSCTLTIPATLLTRAGAFTITLENVAPSLGASTPSTFTVLDRVPTLTSVTPNPIEALSGNTQITLTGDYFAPNADALWNGETLTRVSVNRTTLVATVPASRLTLATIAQITVRNPQFSGRGGGTSTPAQNLVITNPTPRLTSLTPAFTVAVTSGTGAVVTLNGTGFMPGAPMVQSFVEMSVSDSAGTPSGVWSVVPSTYQSASRMSVSLPDALLHQPAVFTLRVVSPQINNQGGGTSEERLFTVRAPVPVLTALVPTVATLNAQTSDVLVRVEGANFTNTSVVRVANVPVPTKYLSPTALEATVQRPASAYTVTVNNPPVNAQGGGTSSGLRLVIVNPVPTLTAVQPATLASTGAPDTVTLKGTNFITGVKVLYNGTALAAASVVVVNDSTLRVLIPTLPIAVTTHTLAVQQPSVITGGETFGGGASQTLPLSIVFPVPTLTSLSPASTAATLNPNAALNHWTLTVRGTLFASNAVVLWNGQTLTTNVVNSTTLRAIVSNTLAQDSGTVVIRVKSNVPSAQGGGTSADSLTLGLYYPVPVLTGIAPEFTTAATLTRLTLTGTNFAPGSGVQLAATFLPAVILGDVQVISPTELQASIPASLLGTRGTYTVRVISPQTASAQGGGQSAAKTLTAVNPAPVLTALLPNTTTASGKPWTLTLVGHSFTSTSQVRYNGVLQSVVNTDFIPNVQADTLRVKLPAVPVNDTTFFLSVYNPPTTVNGQPSGGGESDTLRLAVGLPSPTITNISPTTTTATLGDRARVWTLTINGTFFDNTAKVFVGGLEVPTEFVAATRLRVVLPDSMQFYQARRTVQVKNTPTLTSNIVNLTVQNPAPVLTAIAPSSILAGRDTTIVLTGDRFAPNSTVRLTYGTTNTFLTPTLRDSVIGLTVTVPGALTRTKGAYTLRVSNPALQPTMVPPDTLLLGGGLSAAQTLTVNSGSATSVEYIGLDTLLYAGDRLWFFTLRFRDAVGNLVDNDPVTLNYTNLDSSSTNGASITGTFPMTRTSLGNYRADTLRFPVAGVYALTVDTTQTGTLTVIGANRFTVLTRPAVRVELTGLKETQSAGETQHVQVRYYDNQNNLTDNSVRPVIVTAPLTGGYRYVLGYTRMSTGVYDMETVRYTTSGNYTISFTGIDTLNITGNGVPYNRRFTVQTIPAASVRFTNVNPFLTAGNAQNRFTAAFRDTFGNLTDALTTEQLVVQYSNSTTASVGDSIVSGAITLSRLSLGTYQADVAERFPVVGSYNFTVQGINSTSGTAAFRVQPAGDARVEFAGVRDTLVAGDSLSNVTLKYWDVNGNLTDNNLGDIILTKRSPAPTFPARMAKTRISTGVYAVQTTQATLAGAYDLTVLGITAQNTGGNRNVVVVPAAVTNVDFVITTTAMTRAGARASITATYHDRFGNLADFAGDLTLSNSEYASVATVSMVRSRLGVYTGTIVLYAPGSYAVQIAGNSANITIGGTEAFALEPGPAVRADFQNVLPALTAGGLQSAFTVLLRDRRGSPTDVWNGAMAFDAPASGVTGTLSYDWDNGNPAMYGIITATPTAFTKSGAYTLSLNGGITQHVGIRTFAVAPAPAQTAYILTTPANATVTAGGTVSVRVRFTDSFGNLTAVTNSMMLQQAGTTLATAPLAATGIKGEYTAVFRPATSGTLTFALETPVTIAGTTAITVLPTTDYRVELDGVKTNMVAGETQNPFTVTYRDRYGNLTDSTVGAVIVRLVGGTERDTLQMQRLAKGEYQAEALTVTKVGTYLITISGISTANITGDSAFVVTPDVAAQAVFQNVPTTINVNANLPAFTVRYRDRFDNPVDYNGTVGFTNSASPFVQAGLTPMNAQAIPMSRTAIAVSTATLTPVSVAGDYALTVQGLTTLTGTTAFTVRPLAAASAEIRNVQERVSAGDSLPPFIVLYRDKAGNVTEYNRNLTLTRVGTSASLTVPMKRIAIGVSTASVATELVTPGTYRLSVPGLTTVSGATTVVVVSTNAVSKVDFWGVTPTLTAGSTQASFSVYFRNAQDDLTDYDGTLRYKTADGTTSGTIALTRQELGIYTAEAQTFTRAGSYTLTTDGIATTTGTRSFVVEADSLRFSAIFSGVTSASVVGRIVPSFTVTFLDKYGNLLPSLTSLLVRDADSIIVDTARGTVQMNGALRIDSLRFQQNGFFTIEALDVTTQQGQRTIDAYYGRPQIAKIEPPEIEPLTSSTIQVNGANFNSNSSAFFHGVALSTKLINDQLLEVIIPEELTYTMKSDSLVIKNYVQQLTSNPVILNFKGVPSLTGTEPLVVQIDNISFPKVIDTNNIGITADVINIPKSCLNSGVSAYIPVVKRSNSLSCPNDKEMAFPIVAPTSGSNKYDILISKNVVKTTLRCIGAGQKKIDIRGNCSVYLPGRIDIYNPVPKIDSVLIDGFGFRWQKSPQGELVQVNTINLARFESDGGFTVTIKGRGFVFNDPGSMELKFDRYNCSIQSIYAYGIALGNIEGTEMTFRLNRETFVGLLSANVRSCILKMYLTNRFVYNPSGTDKKDTVAVDSVLFNIYNPNPRIASVRNINNPSPQRPYIAVRDNQRSFKILGFNLQNCDIILRNQDGFEKTIVTDTVYRSHDNDLPEYESIKFKLDTSDVQFSQRFTIIARNRTTTFIRSAEAAYLYVYPIAPRVTEVTAPGQKVKASFSISPLVVDGNNYDPTSRIAFNNIAATSTQFSAITKLSASIQGSSVRIGNNLVTVTTPAMKAQEYSNNLISGSPFEVEINPSALNHFTSNGGTSSGYIFADGIRPTNARLLYPSKVIFDATSNQNDTAFVLTGDSIYSKSQIRYADTLRQTSLNSSNQLSSSKLRILRSGIDTLYIANPYINDKGDTAYYFSNPVTFRAYEAALLPRMDSTSPKQVRTNGLPSLWTLRGANFNEQSLIRATFRACTNSAIESIVIQPDIIGRDWNPTTIFLENLVSRFRNREGTISLQALNSDSVGLKNVAKIFVTNASPRIDKILAKYNQFDTVYRLGLPFLGIDYIRKNSILSDTLWAGVTSENKQLDYYIIRGVNLMNNPCLEVNANSVYLKMDGVETNFYVFEGSNTEIHFSGFVPPASKGSYLTFSPGNHRFELTNKNKMDTEEPYFQTIYSPNPTIEVVRRFPNLVPIPNDNNATNGITVDYRDSLRVRIYSGGDLAPKAKNLMKGARMVVNNNSLPKGLEPTFLENGTGNDKFALDVNIPAIYLSAYNTNSLVVRNPSTGFGNDGGNSASYYFRTRITYPLIRLDSISPARIPVGSTETLITIRGANFTPNTAVRVRRFDSLEIGRDGNPRPVFSEEILPVIPPRIDSTGIVVRLRAGWRDRIGVDTLFVYNPGNLPSLAQTALLHVSAAPPSITQIVPATPEAFIPGEPTKADTISITGQYFDDVTHVLWNDTLQLNILSHSPTELKAYIPDSLHKGLGRVSILLSTADSLSANGFVTLVYPRTEIDSIRPNPIELPDLPSIVAYKDGGNLTSSNERSSEFPVYAGLPTTTELYPNAPNPFDGQTTIEYAVPDDATLGIEIYDPLGKQIADLVPRKLHKAGFYSVQWNAGQQTASGVYTAVLQSTDAKGKFTRKTIRMTVIR